MPRTPLAAAAVLVGCCALLTGLAAAPAAATDGSPAGQPSWHADQAGVPAARSPGRAGEGVVVAVLDSWVDGSHRDLAGRVLAGADCLGGSCTPGPAVPDECEHGTHVAGTVAATSYGVAPRATVLPVRVLAHDPDTDQCTGRPEDVVAGIRWAVQHGARVLNLSLGPDAPDLSASAPLQTAVRQAAEAGTLVVVSAGNSGQPVADAYRGSAIVVAATGPDGGLASYSRRGTGVDLAAPGGDPRTPDVCRPEDCVTSLFPHDRYSVAAGTSMAAPHVSGVAALLLGQDPARSREQLVDRLLSSARPLAGAGRGRLDARAALVAVAARPPGAAAAPQPAVPADVPAPAPAGSGGGAPGGAARVAPPAGGGTSAGGTRGGEQAPGGAAAGRGTAGDGSHGGAGGRDGAATGPRTAVPSTAAPGRAPGRVAAPPAGTSAPEAGTGSGTASAPPAASDARPSAGSATREVAPRAGEPGAQQQPGRMHPLTVTVVLSLAIAACAAAVVIQRRAQRR